MPFYTYKGRRENGDLAEGEIEAANSSVVAGQLMERGVIPLDITEKKVKVDFVDEINRKLNLYKVSIEELLMFTRQMSALIKAGIPVTRAINGIQESISNPLLIDALQILCLEFEFRGRSGVSRCAS